MTAVSKIPGAKVLLMGDTGVGKTFAIRSLIEAGITPFILFTEPGMETLSDTVPMDPLSKLLKDGKHPYHWNYISPTVSDWSALLKIGETVNSLSYAALCKMVDSNRSKYKQWADVIKLNNDFICSECGEHFGDVQDWGTDRALVMDSLSGFSEMCFRLYIGGAVAKDLPDYQIAQEMLMRVLQKWLCSTHCWFVMTAHEERESDSITGMIRRFPKSIGKAIASDIPLDFSDVIECIRIGNKFTWDTAAVGAATKARNVPVKSELPPSFVPLVARWKQKGGVIAPSEPREAAV